MIYQYSILVYSIGLIGYCFYLLHLYKQHNKNLNVKLNQLINKEKTKSDFISVMSHEIRTPLNGIIGITDLLTRELFSKDVRDKIKLLQYSTSNLMNVVNDILDFSKIEAGKIKFEEKAFDLHLLIENIKNTIAIRTDQKGLDLQIVVDKNISTNLKGDKHRLNQVLLNILDNAIKFTKKGFIKLVIESKRHNSLEQTLNFTITDSGIGIAKEKINLITQKYTQANIEISGNYGGTGLGLPICKQLIELQGGSLKIRSQEGIGSSFSFTITYEVSSSNTPTNSNTSKNKDLGFHLSGLKILFVEDDNINQFVAQHIFDYFKITYTTVSDGIEALALLKNEEFDLIIMDYHLPELDGLKTTKTIRNSSNIYLNPDIPIIIATADIAMENFDQFIKAGADDYIIKPFSLEDFGRKIQDFVSTKNIRVTKKIKRKLTFERTHFVYFDISYVQNLVGNEINILFPLLTLSLKKIPVQIEQLNIEVNNNKSKNVIDIIHNLKSNFRSCGLLSLANQLEFIEQTLINSRNKKITILIQDNIASINDSYNKAKEEITTWIDNNKHLYKN